MFKLVDQGDHWHILIAQRGFAVLVASQQGGMPATFVERFPTRIRYTGLAVSYNIALALFGGTTPMLATWLIHEFKGNVMMPAYYLLFASIVSFLAILQFDETANQDLT